MDRAAEKSRRRAFWCRACAGGESTRHSSGAKSCGILAAAVVLILASAASFSCGEGQPSTTGATASSVSTIVSTTGTTLSGDTSTGTSGRTQRVDQVGLSDAQKEVLARQSFVAVASPAGEESWKFWQVYESARYQGLPLLVTTDSVLNAYHGLFDTLLQRMEEQALFEQAVLMTDALYAAASDQWNAASDPIVKEDARLNMAYFLVARALLTGTNRLD